MVQGHLLIQSLHAQTRVSFTANAIVVRWAWIHLSTLWHSLHKSHQRCMFVTFIPKSMHTFLYDSAIQWQRRYEGGVRQCKPFLKLRPIVLVDSRTTGDTCFAKKSVSNYITTSKAQFHRLRNTPTHPKNLRIARRSCKFIICNEESCFDKWAAISDCYIHRLRAQCLYSCCCAVVLHGSWRKDKNAKYL